MGFLLFKNFKMGEEFNQPQGQEFETIFCFNI